MFRVRKEILILLSGILWSLIGVLLNSMAISWLIHLNFSEKAGAVIVGLILGLTISSFGFNRLIKINTNRILKYEAAVCIFAFQSWKSYLIFLVMVTMGFFMRTSGFVPMPILTPVYMGIGLALFISSLKYYRAYLKVR